MGVLLDDINVLNLLRLGLAVIAVEGEHVNQYKKENSIQSDTHLQFHLLTLLIMSHTQISQLLQ